MFAPYNIPDHLNKDYMRGYEDGYEACRVDMLKQINKLKAVAECTGTVSVEQLRGE